MAVRRCAAPNVAATQSEIAAVKSLSGFSKEGATRVLQLRERLLSLRRSGLPAAGAVLKMSQDLAANRGGLMRSVLGTFPQQHEPEFVAPGSKRPRVEEAESEMRARAESSMGVSPSLLKSARLSFGSVFSAEDPQSAEYGSRSPSADGSRLVPSFSMEGEAEQELDDEMLEDDDEEEEEDCDDDCECHHHHHGSDGLEFNPVAVGAPGGGGGGGGGGGQSLLG